MSVRQRGSTSPINTGHYSKTGEQAHSRSGAKAATKLTVDQKEESPCLIGHRSGNQCFTSARRTIQQDPTRRLRTKARNLDGEPVSECLRSLTGKLLAFDKASPIVTQTHTTAATPALQSTPLLLCMTHKQKPYQ